MTDRPETAAERRVHDRSPLCVVDGCSGPHRQDRAPAAERPDAGEGLTERRCDHLGECRPEQRECQWVHFRRVYIECDCGGWDQFWRSRSGAEFLAGRKNHRRECPNNLAARETAAAEAVVGRIEALADEWESAHREEDDNDDLGLYSVAYRECAHDLRAALRAGDDGGLGVEE